ncbi:MAG TPA: FxDxF family PEP-CTERM protein, partial [Phenylobacterium sp.]|nr:FxDxF family PEP-CTERM protein [Phenylobacterium sp.]
VFGDLGISTPTFDDIFTFTVPAGNDGKADFTVTSTMSNDSQNIAFSTVTFNSLPFDTQVSGWNETRTLNHVPVTAGSSYTLELAGSAGVAGTKPNASYSGVITFAPVAAIPEPAAWALMMVGFGGTGALLRRRRMALAVCNA